MSELEQVVDASVVKGGETPIEIMLSRRSAVGLRVQVKTFPQIEAFMRSLGTGTTIPVELSGRHWRPVRKEDGPLMAYDLTERIEQKAYCLDALGQPLEREMDLRIATPGSQMPINLSFLRLVGISEGPGVSFQLRGVYSFDAERALGERLMKAATQVFIDYIRPVDVIVKVSIQEVKGQLDPNERVMKYVDII